MNKEALFMTAKWLALFVLLVWWSSVAGVRI